jgi:hypothetical protein
MEQNPYESPQHSLEEPVDADGIQPSPVNERIGRRVFVWGAVTSAIAASIGAGYGVVLECTYNNCRNPLQAVFVGATTLAPLGLLLGVLIGLFLSVALWFGVHVRHKPLFSIVIVTAIGLPLLTLLAIVALGLVYLVIVLPWILTR